MDVKTLLLRENDRVQDYIVRSCSDLTDEQVNYAHEAVDGRGIGHLVLHLYGALVVRAAAVAGQERPELPADPPKTKAELLTLAESMHETTAGFINQIREERLDAVVTIRPGVEMKGSDAVMQGFSHAARHIGNLLDARHLGGFETHALG